MSRPVLIIGAGGHAKVVADALLALGFEVLGFTDTNPAMTGKRVLEYPVLGSDDVLAQYLSRGVPLANGIGSISGSAARATVYLELKRAGHSFLTLVHPKATVSDNARVEEGCQIMAGALVQAGSVIGENAIVNTGAIVDHDCVIGAHSHVAPGATLCGAVRIGEQSLVGSGATIIQGLCVGVRATVAAGAVVVHDVADGTRVVGVPARSASA